MEVYTEGDTDEILSTLERTPKTEAPKPMHAISTHVSVIGYEDDRQAIDSGIPNMLEVVELLRTAEIPCCMMDVAPLQYYGAARSRPQFVLCVPTALHARACETIRLHPQRYDSFQASVLSYPFDIQNMWPRFKIPGVRLFFVVAPAYAYHIDCTPSLIEYSQSGMPYPTLPHFAQSLIETQNLVDLVDLIDGMDLTSEWGEKNLDLKSPYDVKWWEWKHEQLRKQAGPDGLVPVLVVDRFQPKDLLWKNLCSDEQKRKRQGIKGDERKATRFRSKGEGDPRGLAGRRGV